MKLTRKARKAVIKKLHKQSTYLTKRHFNTPMTIVDIHPYQIDLVKSNLIKVELHCFNNGFHKEVIDTGLTDNIILSYHWYMARRKAKSNDFDYLKLLENMHDKEELVIKGREDSGRVPEEG